LGAAGCTLLLHEFLPTDEERRNSLQLVGHSRRPSLFERYASDTPNKVNAVRRLAELDDLVRTTEVFRLWFERSKTKIAEGGDNSSPVLLTRANENRCLPYFWVRRGTKQRIRRRSDTQLSESLTIR
jgi:hypothetical protein